MLPTGHFIGISLFSVFMPYGCECVKWTASLLGGPRAPRLNLPSTAQRLIRDETVSSFSVNWIPQHLFPTCLVPRCTSVVQVKFSRVFEEFVTWGGDAESDRVATEIQQLRPWMLISLWSSTQRCCPIGSSRHPTGRCSTCGGAS